MRVEQVTLPLVREIIARPLLAGAFFRFDRWGNPLSDEAAANPFTATEKRRAEGAIVHSNLYQQWFVVGYEEARTVLASSKVGVAGQAEVLLAVRPYSKLSDRAKQFMATWLVFVDPPDHTRLRRLVSKAFTPRRIQELEPAVADLTDALLDDLPASGAFEVMEPFCNRLPVAVIGRLLGIPEDRWEWTRHTTAEFARLLNIFGSFDPADMSDVVDEIFDYYSALIAERRADPQDDLLSAMVAAEEDGDRLTEDELIAMIAFLMGAGHETTSNLLGLSLINLARNPDQRDRLVAEPELWPNAVEELIRFDSSIKTTIRHTTADLTVTSTDGTNGSADAATVTIPAGANILVEVLAANRDPRRHHDPNRLLVDRDDPAPLSFGHGIHHCLGHALARLETRIGLQRFIDRHPHYVVDEASISWKSSAVLRGPERLVIIG